METNFDTLGLGPELLNSVYANGYRQPTPIQLAGIPPLLAGRDLIGQSKTGSGKTAAFGLPMINGIQLDPRSVQALVLCPTRELSSQVARELRKLGRNHSGLTVVELVGGQPSKPQRLALVRGVHIAVGTPGRVLDHLQREFLDPSTVRTVVLDEADRMLDMGFGEQVARILSALPAERQTALFSATFPDRIEAMSSRHQMHPVRITIEDSPLSGAPIRQLCINAEADHKLSALCSVLEQYPHESALVFCNFKASVVELTRSLTQAGISADRLDGDLDQFHRDQVLARFRNKSLRLLIATDVAGRGIDVEGLDLVVNFEIPQQPEAYLHRIGRTGRAGKSGVAVSIAGRKQAAHMEAIEAQCGGTIEVIDVGELGGASLGNRLRKLALPAEMVTILISGGRKDKVRPGDILGALTASKGGLEGATVGKIEISERLSYVAVTRQAGRSAVALLNQGRIKGKRFRATLIGA